MKLASNNQVVRYSTRGTRVKMTDESGQVYFWTFRWAKGSRASGWSFTDHDGYDRFCEGNWLDFVPFFRMIATNYGFTTTLS